VPDAATRVGGRYRLGRRLAAGGMGTVWEGWDERLHRTIAIKRLHMEPWHSDDERNVGIQRAMREARLTARLHHPNVVQVYDIVDDAQSPCLIMEYVPSRSLHDLVHDAGPLPPAEVAAIGAQIALGLAAAHAAGIVHRDMKPGNVLVAADGTAKVSDFGISHAFDDVTVTSTGILVGTPAYLAPEVARGAAPDFATDVYSLAATLYMAVEGKPPFGTDDNPIAVLHRVATGEWDQPTRAGALTPMLTRMMALDPDERPAMTEVAAALRELQQNPVTGMPTQVLSVPSQARTAQAPAPAYAPMPPSGPPPQARPTRRRFGALPVLAALLVVLLGGVIGWALLSGNGTSGQPAGHSAANPPQTNRPQTNSEPTGGGSTGSGTRSETGGSNPVGHGQPTAQQLADAISYYFQVVPGDLNTGWKLLTPHFQQTRAQGWSAYQDYWNSVERVDVTSVEGQPPHTAVANLVYHYDNGEVVSQTTSFTLQRQDGTLKIAAEG
jgi:eukaryotic-like serine/threonine-protein kinase